MRHLLSPLQAYPCHAPFAGADEAPYVVKVYPCAVVTCLTWLIHASRSDLGLTGVWWGLALYYLVLLMGFSWRYFVMLRPKR